MTTNYNKDFKPNKNIDTQVGKIDYVKKGSETILIISYKEFNGYPYIDIRDYYKNKDGELRPTKTGITLPLSKDTDNLDLFIELLNKAKEIVTELRTKKEKEINDSFNNRITESKQESRSSDLGL